MFTNQSKFNRTMVHLSKSLKAVKGQSLAEFAVITAMMATFITTALPTFSGLMETGKANKSIDELDKLLVQAKNFYETTATMEGRGRLPGQDKFDMGVGGYTDTTALFNDQSSLRPTPMKLSVKNGSQSLVQKMYMHSNPPVHILKMIQLPQMVLVILLAVKSTAKTVQKGGKQGPMPGCACLPGKY